jgi:type III secretory pathway component EscT
MRDAGLLEAIAGVLETHGVDLAAWGIAWARVAPVIAIVPAFGLRAWSPSLRAAASLLLAITILPAVRPLALSSVPFPIVLVTELVRGTIVAVTAAIPLWAATMAGGVVDALRGSQDLIAMPTVEDRATPLGVLLSLFAAVLFLAFGGPARVLGLLATGPVLLEGGATRVAADIAAGVGIAVAIAAPILAASIVLEIAGALVARAASPAHLHAFLAPIRSLVLLALTALLLERVATFMALFVHR